MTPGTKLGRYEVLSKLGAGGMGEVYLAQDMTLHRKVALKILPNEVAADPNRMTRFVQEARAASALNHPTSLRSTKLIRVVLLVSSHQSLLTARHCANE
jgi:serine/threonine protein kinase